MKQSETIDANDLKKAVLLLLDPRYGAQRSKRVRDQLLGREEPKDRPFQRDAKVLNELLRFGRTVSATAAIGILDDADQKREELIEDKAKNEGADADRRRYLADYMRGLRHRKSLAVQIENLRRGKRMTEDEKAEFLKETTARWNLRRDKFVSEHPEIPYDDARIAFTKQLEQELKDRLERARASGSVKAESTSVQRSAPKGKAPLTGWKKDLDAIRKRK